MFLFTLSLFSSVVSVDLTDKVAKNFLVAHKIQNRDIVSFQQLNVEKLDIARIYDLNPVGYIIVTLDKNEVPIKAFSLDKNFNDTSNEFKSIVSNRLYELTIMRQEFYDNNKTYNNVENQTTWSYYENFELGVSKELNISSLYSSNLDTPSTFINSIIPSTPSSNDISRKVKDVSPLIETHWNQNIYPYALANPHSINSGSKEEQINLVMELYNVSYYQAEVMLNERNALMFPAGCVATAWAQLINFHQFPIQSVGNINYVSYYDKYSSSGINIVENLKHTYNWEAIQRNNSDKDSKEIIKLLQNIGYAIQSDFASSASINGTSAYTINSINGMQKYFGYSTNMQSIYLNGQDDFNDNFEQILEIITSNLDKYRPLIFSYQHEDMENGHAVVVDGYMKNGIEKLY